MDLMEIILQWTDKKISDRKRHKFSKIACFCFQLMVITPNGLHGVFVPPRVVMEHVFVPACALTPNQYMVAKTVNAMENLRKSVHVLIKNHVRVRLIIFWLNYIQSLVLTAWIWHESIRIVNYLNRNFINVQCTSNSKSGRQKCGNFYF